MNTVLGTRKQQSDFEQMMEEELVTLVESQDSEKGIRLLVETLKKQHVANFAM